MGEPTPNVSRRVTGPCVTTMSLNRSATTKGEFTKERCTGPQIETFELEPIWRRGSSNNTNSGQGKSDAMFRNRSVRFDSVPVGVKRHILGMGCVGNRLSPRFCSFNGLRMCFLRWIRVKGAQLGSKFNKLSSVLCLLTPPGFYKWGFWEPVATRSKLALCDKGVSVILVFVSLCSLVYLSETKAHLLCWLNSEEKFKTGNIIAGNAVTAFKTYRSFCGRVHAFYAHTAR